MDIDEIIALLIGYRVLAMDQRDRGRGFIHEYWDKEVKRTESALESLKAERLEQFRNSR